MRVACAELLDIVLVFMLKAFFKLLKILGFLLVFEMKLFKGRIEILGVCVCVCLFDPFLSVGVL